MVTPLARAVIAGLSLTACATAPTTEIAALCGVWRSPYRTKKLNHGEYEAWTSLWLDEDAKCVVLESLPPKPEFKGFVHTRMPLGEWRTEPDTGMPRRIRVWPIGRDEPRGPIDTSEAEPWEVVKRTPDDETLVFDVVWQDGKPSLRHNGETWVRDDQPPRHP
ncbi:MAG: hypothetical protein NXI31_19935 [bacterium]|nr:hypothetical protein [bacterium]